MNGRTEALALVDLRTRGLKVVIIVSGVVVVVPGSWE